MNDHEDRNRFLLVILLRKLTLMILDDKLLDQEICLDFPIVCSYRTQVENINSFHI